MGKLKAAVIGCGGAGANHAAGYAMHSDVMFVGAADLDASRAQALAAKYGGKAYGSYEELILAEQPDVVSVCTR